MYKNQGDILSYNPDLFINSKPNSSEATTIVNTEYEGNPIDYVVDKVERSASLESFEAQKPSLQVNDLMNMQNYISKYKTSIEDTKTSNTYVNRYFSTGDESIKKEILDENFNDLENGSTRLEVYHQLENIEHELSEVSSLYIECVFGKDIDENAIEYVESAYIDRLKQLEDSNEHHKINYFNLHYDTQISFLLREYITNMYGVIAELGYLDDEAKNIDESKINRDMFKDAFNKVNTLLINDLYKDEKCCTDILTAMKNIFLTKIKVNSYFDTFSEISSFGDCVDDILEIKEDSINELEDKLDMLINSMLFSTLSKEDITNTLKKKSNYRSFLH